MEEEKNTNGRKSKESEKELDLLPGFIMINRLAI
jgi:hypothetical protein